MPSHIDFIFMRGLVPTGVVGVYDLSEDMQAELISEDKAFERAADLLRSRNNLLKYFRVWLEQTFGPESTGYDVIIPALWHSFLQSMGIKK